MTPFATALVYCAAGAQGSAIVRTALAAGERVRILLREGRANPFGTHVEVVRGDLADPATLRLASLGVGKVVLTLPQLADRALAAQFGRNAIAAAKAAGVKLLVWNAGGPVPPAHTGVAVLDAAVDTARALGASGIPAITVRPTLYMENLIASWSAPGIVHNGVFAHPLPADAPVSWIGWKDLAAFVAAALMRPDLAGRAFDIGGPQMLRGPEIAAILSTAIGRRVDYVPVPLSYFAAGLNAVLGGKSGDQIAAFYGWVRCQAISPLAVDLEPALAELSVKPTALSDWAKAQDWIGLASSGKAA